MKPIVKALQNGVYEYVTVKDVGDLDQLKTNIKTDLVAAINGLIDGGITGFGGMTSDEVNSIIDAAVGQSKSDLQGMIGDQSASDLEAARKAAEVLANKMLQDALDKVAELNTQMTKDVQAAKDELSANLKAAQDEAAENLRTVTAQADATDQSLKDAKDDLEDTKAELQKVTEASTKVSQDIDKINGVIDQKVDSTDFDLLNNSVEKNKTEIKQTKDKIELAATKEELDLLTEDVSKAQASIDLTNDKIAQTVSREDLAGELDAWDMQKANLLSDSRTWDSNTWKASNDAAVTITGDKYQSATILTLDNETGKVSASVSGLTVGKTYTLSVFARKQTTSGKIEIHSSLNKNAFKNSSNDTYIGNESMQRFFTTFVAQSVTETVDIYATGNTDSNIVYLVKAKLETGDKPTTWEPNSNDVFASVDILKAERIQTAGKIEDLVKRQKEIDDKQVTEDTFRTQTEKKLTSQAETVEKQGKDITATKSLIEQTSTEIKQTVSKETSDKLAALQAGSSNLINNSDFSQGKDVSWTGMSAQDAIYTDKDKTAWLKLTQTGTKAENILTAYSNYFPVQKNDSLAVTAQFMVKDFTKLADKRVVKVEFYDKDNIRVDFTELSLTDLGVTDSIASMSAKNIAYKTTVTRDDVAKARVLPILHRDGEVYFTKFYARLTSFIDGSWQMSPDDLITTQLALKTEIDQTNEKITLKADDTKLKGLEDKVEDNHSEFEVSNKAITGRVEKTEGSIDDLTGDIKSIKSDYSELTQGPDSITAKVTSLQGEMDENTDELGSQKEKVATLEQTAEGFKTTVSAVENMQVGGRNFFPHADTFEGWSINSSWSKDSSTFDGQTVLKGNQAQISPSYGFNRAVSCLNSDVVISFYARTDATGSVRIHSEPNGVSGGTGGTDFTIGTGWARYQYKAHIGSVGTIYWWALTTGVNIYFSEPQVEMGTIPTAWKVSPEDVSDRFSKVEQTANSVSSTVADMNAKGAIQDRVANVEQTAEGFKSTVTAVENMQVGGANLLSLNNISMDFALTSQKFDYADGSFQGTIPAGGNTPGFGVGISLTGDQNSTGAILPYGKSATFAVDVMVSQNTAGGIDINNFPVSGTAWNGNDNDSTRLPKSTPWFDLKANIWTTMWYTITNSSSGNTNFVALYDRSYIGVKNNGSAAITAIFRHPRWVLGNVIPEWTPCQDDVKVGGVNLLPNTDSYSNWTLAYGATKDSSSPAIVHYPKKVLASGTSNDFLSYSSLSSLKPDTDYVLSFNAHGSGNLTTYVYPNVGTGDTDNNKTWTLDGTEKRYVKKFHTLSNISGKKTLLFRNNGTTLEAWISQVKLEAGTVATEWSQAPEDTITRISLIEQNAEGIKTTVSAMNEKGPLQNRVSTVEQTAEGLKTYVGNIRQAGKNLVYNGDAELGLDGWTSNSINNVYLSTHPYWYNGKKNFITLRPRGTGTNDETYVVSKQVPVKRNTTYHLHFHWIAPMNISSIDVYQGGTDADNLTGSWKPASDNGVYDKDFNTGNRDSVQIRIDLNGATDGKATWLGLSEISLTEGAGVVPYAPSSDNSADSVKFSQLSQTIDGFKTTVTDVSGEGGLKDRVSKVEQTADGLKTTVGSNINPNLITNSGYPTIMNGFGWVYTGSSIGITKHTFYRNGKANLFEVDNTSTTAETYLGTNRFPVTPGKKYTVSFLGFAGSNVKNMDVFFLSRPSGSGDDFNRVTQMIASRVLSPTKAEYVTATFTAPDGVDEGFLRFDNNGSKNGKLAVLFLAEIKCEYGEIATPWSKDASDTLVTQTANNWSVFAQTNGIFAGIKVDGNGVIDMSAKKVTIPGALIVGGSIPADALKNGSITKTQLADNSVDSSKIAANAVTGAKMANGTVTATQLASNAVTTTKIADKNINAAKLADGTITSEKIANGAIASINLANNSVSTAKIAGGAITASQIGKDAITSVQIKDGAVTAGAIAAGAVGASAIAANVITADKIGAGAITADKIQANAIDGKTITGATLRSPFDGKVAINTTSKGQALIQQGVLSIDAQTTETSGSSSRNWIDNILVGNGEVFTQTTTNSDKTQESASMRGGSIYLSSSTNGIFTTGVVDARWMSMVNACGTQLWHGGNYMHAGQTVTPTLKLSQCLNGWVLCWSRWDAGTGQNDSRFWYEYIPKFHGKLYSDRGITAYIDAPASPTQNLNSPATKYLYVTDSTIRGYDGNNKGGAAGYTLREVYAW